MNKQVIIFIRFLSIALFAISVVWINISHICWLKYNKPFDFLSVIVAAIAILIFFFTNKKK